MLQNGLWSPRQVMRSGAAELVPITIGRDYGDRVEVLTGLDAADEVIINPSDSLVSGAAVRLVNHKAGEAASDAPASRPDCGSIAAAVLVAAATWIVMSMP
jgi:hypothetical protein